MAVQIANPEVVRKIEWLATTLNTSKTAAVERALDAYSGGLLQAQMAAEGRSNEQLRYERLMSIVKKFDAIPDANPNSPSDLEWDENGLPI
jgi:antitoxin VapB